MVRYRQKQKSAFTTFAGMKTNTISNETSDYRAVSIEPDWRGCCEASLQQKDSRYLAAEAPSIPLPECSQSTRCRCKYKHWEDRRQGDRRTPYNGLAAQYYGSEDRRERPDRRQG